MKRNKKQKWTAAEDALLQEYYHTLSKDALFAIFRERSYREMTDRAYYLKRKNKPFKMRNEV